MIPWVTMRKLARGTGAGIGLLSWVIAGWWSGVAAATERLEPGDPFPAFITVDQHDVPFEFKPGILRVVIAFEMPVSKAANKVLAAEGAGFLEGHQAIYVANIHGMPAMGRMFALPKMRKYPHRIILADSEELLAPFPREEGELTVVRVDGEGRIESFGHLQPAALPAGLRGD